MSFIIDIKPMWWIFVGYCLGYFPTKWWDWAALAIWLFLVTVKRTK